jgi:hypothetical protein
MSAQALLAAELGPGGRLHCHLDALFAPGAAPRRAYLVSDIAPWLARCGRVLCLAADSLFPPSRRIRAPFAICLVIMLGTLMLLARVGTFWAAFSLANGILLLPGAVLRPPPANA